MAGLAEASNKGFLRRLYDICMEWLEKPFGIYVLFIIAAVCAVGSVLGGAFGYGLGLWAMESIGRPIVDWYGLADKYEEVQHLYREYDALAIFAAGFTPLPYKLFTITAGAFHINFPKFILVSLLSRSARFFLVAAIIYKFGAPVRVYIERYFNILSIVFMILLVAGFALIKIVL